MAEVDRAELAESQETEAEKIFKADNAETRTVVDVLTKVQKVDQLPVFYSGGFRILKSLIQSSMFVLYLELKCFLSFFNSYDLRESCSESVVLGALRLNA